MFAPHTVFALEGIAMLDDDDSQRLEWWLWYQKTLNAWWPSAHYRPCRPLPETPEAAFAERLRLAAAVLRSHPPADRLQ